MIQLYHVVKRGARAGAVLRPHRGRDGAIVLRGPAGLPDVRVRREGDTVPYLLQGYKLRMSEPGARGASLISFKRAA